MALINMIKDDIGLFEIRLVNWVETGLRVTLEVNSTEDNSICSMARKTVEHIEYLSVMNNDKYLFYIKTGLDRRLFLRIQILRCTPINKIKYLYEALLFELMLIQYCVDDKVELCEEDINEWNAIKYDVSEHLINIR